MSSPELDDLIRGAARAEAGRIRAIEVGRVLSYDDKRNTCSVQVLAHDLVEDGLGTTTAQELPVLDDVPVMQLRGKGFSLLVALEEGDLVTLLFNDSSLDRLLPTGQGGPPEDPRRHDLNDAMALPGFFTLNAPPPGTSSEYASIGTEKQGGPRIYFKADALCLGAPDPGFHVALGERTEQRLTNLENGFNQHGHASFGAPPTPVPGVIPVNELPGSPPVGDVSSTTVKVSG